MSEELSSHMLTSFFFFKDEVAGLKAEVDEVDKGAGDDETPEEGSEEETTGAVETMLAPPTATELLMA